MRKTTDKGTQKRPVADDYLALVRAFPLRPIRSKTEYLQAMVILKDLIGRADQGLTSGQSDYADVLGRLVREYDQTHSSLVKGKASPIEVLKHLMEEHGM